MMENECWFANIDEDEVQKVIADSQSILIFNDDELDSDDEEFYSFESKGYRCFDSEDKADKLLHAHWKLIHALSDYLQACNYDNWLQGNGMKNSKLSKNVFKRVVAFEAISDAVKCVKDKSVKSENENENYIRNAWYVDAMNNRVEPVFILKSDLKESKDSDDIKVYKDIDLKEYKEVDKAYVFYIESEAYDFLYQNCALTSILQNSFDNYCDYSKPDSDAFEAFIGILSSSIG